nr:hypothetical protein [Tanacetum cinerariifolium]
MSFDEFDKENVLVDELQLRQADLSCVHALNGLYLHEIHVVPKVLMIDYISVVETDKVINTAKTVMVKLVEIESFGMSADELDKEIGSSDGMKPYMMNGPLILPSIKENGVTRANKYSELSATKTIQVDCDVKETNIILQGLLPE